MMSLLMKMTNLRLRMRRMMKMHLMQKSCLHRVDVEGQLARLLWGLSVLPPATLRKSSYLLSTRLSKNAMNPGAPSQHDAPILKSPRVGGQKGPLPRLKQKRKRMCTQGTWDPRVSGDPLICLWVPPIQKSAACVTFCSWIASLEEHKPSVHVCIVHFQEAKKNSGIYPCF